MIGKFYANNINSDVLLHLQKEEANGHIIIGHQYSRDAESMGEVRLRRVDVEEYYKEEFIDPEVFFNTI